MLSLSMIFSDENGSRCFEKLLFVSSACRRSDAARLWHDEDNSDFLFSKVVSKWFGVSSKTYLRLSFFEKMKS